MQLILFEEPRLGPCCLSGVVMTMAAQHSWTFNCFANTGNNNPRLIDSKPPSKAFGSVHVYSDHSWSPGTCLTAHKSIFARKISTLKRVCFTSSDQLYKHRPTADPPQRNKRVFIV